MQKWEPSQPLIPALLYGKPIENPPQGFQGRRAALGEPQPEPNAEAPMGRGQNRKGTPHLGQQRPKSAQWLPLILGKPKHLEFPSLVQFGKGQNPFRKQPARKAKLKGSTALDANPSQHHLLERSPSKIRRHSCNRQVHNPEDPEGTLSLWTLVGGPIESLTHG